MSRSLTAAQDALVEANSYYVENLLEIGSTYYTTGSYDLTATTSTGTHDFVSDNKLLSVGSVAERSYFTNTKFAFQFIGVDLSVPLAFTNGTTVKLFKMFRNTSTNAVESSDPIQVFDGVISSKRLDFDGENHILQIECSPDNIGINKNVPTPPIFNNSVTGNAA